MLSLSACASLPLWYVDEKKMAEALEEVSVHTRKHSKCSRTRANILMKGRKAKWCKHNKRERESGKEIKAPGCDNIHAAILKETAELIAQDMFSPLMKQAF